MPGKKGIKIVYKDFIKSIPNDDLPVKIAGEVKDFNPADYEIEPAFSRKQDKFTTYAVAAAWQAVKQSGLNAYENGNIDPFKFGVYIGSGVGGFHTLVRECEKILTDGPKWVSPLFIPTMIFHIMEPMMDVLIERKQLRIIRKVI